MEDVTTIWNKLAQAVIEDSDLDLWISTGTPSSSVPPDKRWGSISNYEMTASLLQNCVQLFPDLSHVSMRGV
jgi:hypothetical protein